MHGMSAAGRFWVQGAALVSTPAWRHLKLLNMVMDVLLGREPDSFAMSMRWRGPRPVLPDRFAYLAIAVSQQTAMGN